MTKSSSKKQRLPADLQARFGRGFGVDNLQRFRLFYMSYRPEEISATPPRKSPSDQEGEKYATLSRVSATLQATSATSPLADLAGCFPLPWSAPEILQSPSEESGEPGSAGPGAWTATAISSAWSAKPTASVWPTSSIPSSPSTPRWWTRCRTRSRRCTRPCCPASPCVSCWPTILALPPVLLGGVLVVPIGLLRRLGLGGAQTVTVTRNEILYSLNEPEDFILAIVELGGDGHRVHYVRSPSSASRTSASPASTTTWTS